MARIRQTHASGKSRRSRNRDVNVNSYNVDPDAIVATASGTDFEGNLGDFDYFVVTQESADTDILRLPSDLKIGACITFFAQDSFELGSDVGTGVGINDENDSTTISVTQGSVIELVKSNSVNWIGQEVDLSGSSTLGSSFALTNGSGTTANGTAVDLGGILSTNVDIETGAGDNWNFHDNPFNNYYELNLDDSNPYLDLFLSGDGVSTENSNMVMSQGSFTIFARDNSNDFYLDSASLNRVHLISKQTIGSDFYGVWGAPDNTAIAKTTGISNTIQQGLQITNSAITITDLTNAAGVVYAADYSTNFTDRSLIDKAYVDSVAGGLDTVLSKNENITANRTANVGAFDLIFESNVNPYINRITINDFVAELYSENTSTNTASKITNSRTGTFSINSSDTSDFSGSYLSGNKTSLNCNIQDDLYNTAGIQISQANSILIHDNLNSKGAEYSADYSANFTDRSLVDKAYVDSFQLESSSSTTSASITPDADNEDFIEITALDTDVTINAPTGTPKRGQRLVFKILDDGTLRNITWNSVYKVMGVTLPVATTITKLLYVFCLYNSQTSEWDVVQVNEEA